MLFFSSAQMKQGRPPSEASNVHRYACRIGAPEDSMGDPDMQRDMAHFTDHS